jgi:Lar family restriction alleviation protein
MKYDVISVAERRTPNAECRMSYVVCRMSNAAEFYKSENQQREWRIAMNHTDMVRKESLTQEDLKPCPFCGQNEPVLWDVAGSAWVQCGGCSASTGIHNNRDEAVDHWNGRAGR